MSTLTGIVELSQAEFDALPEYSCTLPTGTTPGKRWRRREPYMTGPGVVHTWFMGVYEAVPEVDQIGIRWYQIRVLTPRQAQVRDFMRNAHEFDLAGWLSRVE